LSIFWYFNLILNLIKIHIMKEKNIIERVRQFNRFYIQFFGLYNNNLLENKYSLTEARVIFELGQHRKNTSKELVKILNLDPGYLSRIISKFEKKGYLTRKVCPEDARKQYLYLTSEGNIILEELNRKTNQQIETVLSGLSKDEKDILNDNMDRIEFLLCTKTK
jgi:DNA-binding MarR family transcriptional regulator